MFNKKENIVTSSTYYYGTLLTSYSVVKDGKPFLSGARKEIHSHTPVHHVLDVPARTIR